MRATIDTYFTPNKTIRELHELVESGPAFDPLKDCSEMAFSVSRPMLEVVLNDCSP